MCIRDRDVPGGEFLARCQPYPVRIDYRGAAVVDDHARGLQRGAVGGFQPVKLGLQPVAEDRPVEGLSLIHS